MTRKGIGERSSKTGFRPSVWPDLPEPLNMAALAVLLDLGLSTDEIARYFHQQTGRVEELAAGYRLTRPTVGEQRAH